MNIVKNTTQKRDTKMKKLEQTEDVVVDEQR